MLFNGFGYTLTKYGRQDQTDVTYSADSTEDLIEMIKGFGFEQNTHVSHTDKDILVFHKVLDFDNTDVIVIDDLGEAK